jgi:hypothetical protein|eukprot:SAG25_NODE_556_length_6947_cov_7.702242_7_plen_321_part_00
MPACRRRQNSTGDDDCAHLSWALVTFSEDSAITRVYASVVKRAVADEHGMPNTACWIRVPSTLSPCGSELVSLTPSTTATAPLDDMAASDESDGGSQKSSYLPHLETRLKVQKVDSQSALDSTGSFGDVWRSAKLRAQTAVAGLLDTYLDESDDEERVLDVTAVFTAFGEHLDAVRGDGLRDGGEGDGGRSEDEIPLVVPHGSVPSDVCSAVVSSGASSSASFLQARQSTAETSKHLLRRVFAELDGKETNLLKAMQTACDTGVIAVSSLQVALSHVGIPVRKSEARALLEQIGGDYDGADGGVVLSIRSVSAAIVLRWR